MSQEKPRAGDVWSLNPHAGLDDTPAPLVLLMEKSNESWAASPVFDGDLIAGEYDLRVSEDQDFLDGHCWVAAKESFSVGPPALWNFLDKVSTSVLEQVLLFRRSGVCTLAVGQRLIVELNDPRIKVRNAVLKLVDRCVQADAKGGWVLLLHSAGKQVKAAKRFVDQVLEELSVTLSPEPGLPGLDFARGAVGLVPGTFFDAADAAFKFLNSGKVNFVSFNVGGREIQLSVATNDQVWNVGISVADMPELKSVSIEHDGKQIECIEANGKWWPATGELEPGRYLVSLNSNDEAVSFPMELGQSLAS